MSWFTELSIDVLTNVITFNISSSARDVKWRENALTCMEKYMNHFDTRRYGDFTITDKDSSIQIASDMRVIFDNMFQR